MKMKSKLMLNVVAKAVVIALLILPTVGKTEFAHAAEAAELNLKTSKLELDSGAFWLRKWTQTEKSYQSIDLKTVTNYDSGLLMTFSGADYTYLNQQSSTELKKISENQAQWSFSDSNVDYTRTYEAKGEEVLIHVVAKFKNKAPEKAYLNLVTRLVQDDKEEMDRELFYFSNSEIERLLVKDEIEPTEVATSTKWVGLGSRYFILSVLPDGVSPEKVLIQSTGEKSAQASMQFPVINQAIDLKFRVVFIPKKLDLLRSIDPTLDTTVQLGFFTFLAYPILWTLKSIYKFVGNYGIAIIILTIIVKILTFPLVLKSMKSMRKMAEFQPKMNALKEKYKDDKDAFNREMMLMMKSSGYNPMAGCFPMLLQMPIFFALYQVLYSAVELYQAPFFGYMVDLSARDPYFITPVLMTAVMFFQQKLMPPSPGMDETQRKVMQFMPVIFGAFMLTTPSGLCVYMLVNAITSVIQQQYLNKKLGIPAQAASIASSF
jgi:YidC/Oxa1 family membrane protein insertase